VADFVVSIIMHKQVLKIFEKKLTDALLVADNVALSEGRDIWKDIGPAPSCPHVGALMRNIQHALVRGHVAREKIALKVVSETVASYDKLLSSHFAEELMEVITRAFPRDHYIKFAKNTKRVYARQAQAQKNKFNENAFELELALIHASSSNMANRTISKVHTFLEDELLKKTINTPRKWVRWKVFATPLFKWVLGIMTALLVAFLIGYLGLN